MAESIRQIQLKRTKKALTNDIPKSTQLKFGEPFVTNYGCTVIGDGTSNIDSLKAYVATDVPIPQMPTTIFCYTGENITPQIVNYYSNLCTMSGTITASAIGKYSVQFKLNAVNGEPIAHWSDGTLSDKTIEWEIAEYLPGKVKNSDHANTADRLTTARSIDGIAFDGSQDICHFAKCTSAASTTAKVTTVTDQTFVLKYGSNIKVLFTNSNSASNPTLNINGTGAKPLVSAQGEPYTSWPSSTIIDVIYDGTNYVVNKEAKATTTTAGSVMLNDTEYSTSTTTAQTPRVVNLKCHCYVQSSAPSGNNYNNGDLWINSTNGVMQYWYNNTWNFVHNTWF